MIRLVLAALFVVPVSAWAETCTSDSTGPCAPADDGQKKPIMDAIHAAMAAQETIELPSPMRRLAHEADDDETELKQWSAQRAAVQQMKDAANRAILLTQQAYHLAPTTSNDPRAQKPASRDGDWSTNISAPWVPEFQTSVFRAIKGSDGRLHYVDDDPGDVSDPSAAQMAGMTDVDGKIAIFPFSFIWSLAIGDPGPLASTIHHESRHYEELITTGWDTHERGEIRANNESIKMIDTFLPDVTVGGVSVRGLFKTNCQQIIDDYQETVDAGKEHSPFPDAQTESDNKSKFEQQERDEAAYRDLEARVKKEKLDQASRDAAGQRDLRWQKFKVWSLYACEYIDGVGENDPEWGNPDQIKARDDGLRSYLRTDLVVMAKDEIDTGLKRNDLFQFGDLGRCQEQIVEMIRDLPGPVDDDWIMNKIEYDRNGGRAGELISKVIDSVHRAVLDGTAAIVETMAAPFAADTSSGGDGGGDGGRGNSGGDRSSPRPNIDKLPWQQLRGISERGWQD